MSDEITARVARLERAFGAHIGDIHEFDDADQQVARQEELDANAKADEQQKADLQAAADEKVAAAEAATAAQAEADAAAAAAAAPAPTEDEAAEEAAEIAATAAAKAKADELGVDITSVEPTGAQGQVVVGDVVAADAELQAQEGA